MRAKKIEQVDALVIGAGVAGLTCAYELAKNGKSVLVLENSNVVGGALRSFDSGSYFIEAFYHHVFSLDNYSFLLLTL